MHNRRLAWSTLQDKRASLLPYSFTGRLWKRAIWQNTGFVFPLGGWQQFSHLYFKKIVVWFTIYSVLHMYCTSHFVEAPISPWIIPFVSLFIFAFLWPKSTDYMNGGRQKFPVLAVPGRHSGRLPTLYSARSLHESVKRGLQLLVV